MSCAASPNLIEPLLPTDEVLRGVDDEQESVSEYEEMPLPPHSRSRLKRSRRNRPPLAEE